MRFEDKTEFGLLGEHLVVDVLRWQDNLEVKLNTGPGFQDGFGIRFHAGSESEVVPDIDGIRYSEAGRFGTRTPFYVEVKTKSRFACYENAGDEIRTGINIAAWNHYKWFAFKHATTEFWMVFVHVLPVVQASKCKFQILNSGITGIYRCDLQQLANCVKNGSDGKVYWPLAMLEHWRSASALLAESSTRTIWRQLEQNARKAFVEQL
jgi:hypothetical protein